MLAQAMVSSQLQRAGSGNQEGPVQLSIPQDKASGLSILGPVLPPKGKSGEPNSCKKKQPTGLDC